MTAGDLLKHLSEKGVTLSLDGDRVQYRAPKGALTPELRSAIAKQRDGIIALLRDGAPPSPATGNPPLLEPVPRNQAIPLSYAQHGLWLAVQTSENPPFNHPIAFRIKGTLDTAVLERSINEIVRRHESLHTTCLLRDGNPVLAIQPPWELEDFTVDLRAFESDRREDEIREIAEDAVRKPFDLAQDRLLRARLLRTGEDDFVLILVLHTFVADGLSHGILLQELSCLYDAFSHNSDSPLPANRIEFADYAVWQHKTVQGRHIEDQLSFWKQRLLKGPAALQWPVRTANIGGTYEGETQHFTLSPKLSESIRRLSQSQGVTTFALLLAAVHLLLHRITGQADTLVGTTVSNRPRSELEGLIGYFANNLLLNATIHHRLSFRELMKQCHMNAAEALGNQDYPFERLLEELAVDPGFTHIPSLQVVFVLHDHVAEEDLNLAGLQVEPFPVERNAASFEVYLRMANTGGPIRGSLEYSRDVFDGATVARLIDRFGALLEETVADPDLTPDSLRALNGNQVDSLVKAWRESMEHRAAPLRRTSVVDTQRDSSAPAADPELVRLVTALWRDVLEIDEVGPDENFFELGGRSVHVIQVHSRLEKLIHRDIPVVSMFHYPTVRSLCRHLGDRPDSPSTGPRSRDRGTLLQAAREHRARSRNRQPSAT